MISFTVLAPLVTTFFPAVLFSGDDSATATTTAHTTWNLSETVQTVQSEAKRWELTTEEWTRYEELMQGVRGRLSDSNISPIEVLGIHARNDTERTQYALRWAKIMFEDAERVLQFQRTYDEAVRALTTAIPLVDLALLPAAQAQSASPLAKTDRIMFFVKTDCSICDVLLADVLDQVAVVQGIDIYFTDLSIGEGAAIKDWVQNKQIGVELIQAKQVTVNFDNGLLNSISASELESPALFRRSNDNIERLPLYFLWQ